MIDANLNLIAVLNLQQQQGDQIVRKQPVQCQDKLIDLEHFLNIAAIRSQYSKRYNQTQAVVRDSTTLPLWLHKVLQAMPPHKEH